jgi:hypothetical protein
MTAEPTTAKAAARVKAELVKALGEAKLAYDFVPNSFTYSSLNACLAAEAALDVLREALESEAGALAYEP